MAEESVVMVAEKPSVAEAIARALSPGPPEKTSRGGLGVWRFRGRFEGKPARVRVTSTTGHIFSVDFNSRFNDRERVDETELFDAPIVKKAESKNVIECLRSLNREERITQLVLWLDCDREGENICFEVLEVLGAQWPKCPFGVSRARFSSLVKKDLVTAYEHNLRQPNINEAMSVDARQELDLKIGVVFTRFLTRYLKDFHGGTISYGPCQMPTLWFCVDRQLKIDSFQPQEYFQIELSTRDFVTHWQGNLVNGSPVTPGNKIFDEETATLMLNLFKQEQLIKVTSVTRKRRNVKRPMGLNTLEMLKAASKSLGISPHTAMHICESLYLSGLITYPRTESTRYADSFDVTKVVQMLAGQNSFAQELLRTKGINKNTSGVDVGDHPPITPCSTTTYFQSGDHERIYNLVVMHFLKSNSQDAQYIDITTSLELPLSNSKTIAVFKSKNSQLERPGFLGASGLTFGVYNSDPLPDEVDISPNAHKKETANACAQLSAGDTLHIENVRLVRKLTSRPKLLTESDLITLMDKNGIGTDASVSQHIASIMNRKYVRLVDTRSREIQATTLGMNLCLSFGRIDEELCRPSVRRLIESNCEKISKGLIRKDELVMHVLNEFKVKFQHFLRNVDVLDDMLQLDASLLTGGEGRRAGTPLSRCGKCKRYMLAVQGHKKLCCPHCQLLLTLPSAAKVRPVQDTYRCVYDDFDLLVCVEKSGKAWIFCPLCFNHPPVASAKKGFKCLDDVNSKTMYGSLHMQSLAPCCSVEGSDCRDSEHGGSHVCLQNYPSAHLAIACTDCKLLISVDHDKVKSMTKVLPPKLCEQCGWAFVVAKFTNQYENGEECVGCLGCDERLAETLTGSLRRKKGGSKFRRRRPMRGGAGRS